jgi:hypothetical protein
MRWHGHPSHGGAPERFFGKTVRYRNIRVKVLD